MAKRHAVLTSCLLLTLGWAFAACVPAPGTGKGEAEGEAAQEAEAKPEVVCQHLREVAAKDTQDAQALDQIQRECVETLGTLQSRYRSFTKCVELAGTAQAVYQCEEALAQPPSLLAGASPTAKLEMLCDHVLGLVATELGQAANMTPEQFEQLRAKCINDAGATIERTGVAQFNREADCMLAAQSLKDVQACKGN